MTLALPKAGELPAFAPGRRAWKWTAHFEAFVFQLRPRRPARDPRRDVPLPCPRPDPPRREGARLPARLQAVHGLAVVGHHGVRPASRARRHGLAGARPAPRRRPDRLPGHLHAFRPRALREAGPQLRARPCRAERPVAIRVVLHDVLVPAVDGRDRRLVGDGDVHEPGRPPPDRGRASRRRSLGHRPAAAPGRARPGAGGRCRATPGATTTARRRLCSNSSRRSQPG